MKKTEKIVAAVCIMVFGVLFMILKSHLIGIFMTVLGIGLLVFGVIDAFHQKIAWAVIKIVFGALVIICGWTLFEAVLYVLSAALFALGILIFYELIRYQLCGVCLKELRCVIKLIQPALCILIGLLFLFEPLDWVFITSGILITLEGGVFLFDSIKNE